ncbi:MAG: TonB-dependent receptor [Acidobacteriota bacterium]|jgi:iron complex outermembrane receptor protein
MLFSVALFVLSAVAAPPPTPIAPAPGASPSVPLVQGSQSTQRPAGEPQEPMRYEEIIVVTASRFEQYLPDVPAAISVRDREAIAASPAANYADLLRPTTGLNVAQTSARDISMRPRAATGVVDTGTVVLLDGRSVYQDFFGFVMWDLLPVQLSEIEQVEINRGPGSVMWGPNAMSGVVNLRTRSPRSLGNALRVRAGGGEVGSGGGSVVGSGSSGPWALRGGLSYFTQNAWDRPTTLPSGQPGNFYPNEGTNQFKLDARVDRDLDDAELSLQGGLSTTSGIMMTGMGPFSIAGGTDFWYVMGDYSRGAATVRAYANIVDGEATNLLNQLFFDVNTQAYDFSGHNTSLLADGDHTLTYGGNLRLQHFDLTIAPEEDHREEGGAFVEDQWLLSDRFRVVGGVRVDGFSVVEGPVFSPRVALLMRPDASADHTARVSWGRAYRAPSLLENFADTVLYTPLDLSALTGIPGLPTYVFPSAALGNPDLDVERMDQFEVGYRGQLDEGVWLDMAYYWSKRTDVLMFGPSQLYTPSDPPPGWPLPPGFLALAQLPKVFSFRNIGEIVDQGIEAGIRARVRDHEVFANYSWQAEPDPTTLTLAEINIPPSSRFNAGFSGSHHEFYYGAALTYVGEAVWNDVLDARFHGPTDAFTTLDATFGVTLFDGVADFSVRATNLTNAAFQQHVVGDIISRRVIGEVGFTLR